MGDGDHGEIVRMGNVEGRVAGKIRLAVLAVEEGLGRAEKLPQASAADDVSVAVHGEVEARGAVALVGGEKGDKWRGIDVERNEMDMNLGSRSEF
jgi:hypothetical protein